MICVYCVVYDVYLYQKKKKKKTTRKGEVKKKQKKKKVTIGNENVSERQNVKKKKKKNSKIAKRRGTTFLTQSDGKYADNKLGHGKYAGGGKSSAGRVKNVAQAAA